MREDTTDRRRRARRRPGTLHFAGRAARTVVVSAIGAAIVALGVLLLVLPGPGLLVVGLGLAVLSTEYRWPARLSRRLRDEAAAALHRRRHPPRGAQR